MVTERYGDSGRVSACDSDCDSNGKCREQSQRKRKIQRQSEAVTVTDKYSDIKRVRTEVTIIVRE